MHQTQEQRVYLRAWLPVLLAFLIIAGRSDAVVISTAQFDTSRSGANQSESILNTSNVNVNSFGRLGSYAVDGEVHAQPLYIPGLTINGSVTNVLFVATMHNSIYAFNADKIGSAPLWHVNFGQSVTAKSAGSCPAFSTGAELGILSTPVIDTTTNTLYAVYTTPTGTATYTFFIAAIDILSGAQKTGSPNHIVASVPGTGYDSVSGTITLNQTTQIQRPALTLLNGVVYAGFGSCGPDPDPYHGWILGYSAANVSQQKSVYISTPNGQEGAVWQAGRGLALDKTGNMYASTGNGSNTTSDTSDSVVQFGAAGQPTGVYTDPNFTALSQFDLDLSSSGPLFIGSLNLLVAGGKEGVIHVLDPTKFGTASSPAVQTFQGTKSCGTLSTNNCFVITSLVFWDTPSNPLLYMWGIGDVLRAYRYSAGAFNATPDSIGNNTQNNATGLALSSNGADATTAVLWAMTPDNVLHAYRAVNVAQELYNSTQNATRDSLVDPTHFVDPTIVNGKVYVPTTDGQLEVYGLLGSGTQGAVTAKATFVKTDAATQGSWQGVYGGDGYNVIGDQALNPSYAIPAASGQSEFTWVASTADVRALQKPSNPATRIAATWFAPSTFQIDTGITDQTQHQVALYFLDWQSTSEKQSVDVLDTNGNVIDTETIQNFGNGVYMIWNVTGHVTFRINNLSGPQVLLSGVFFGGAATAPPPPPPPPPPTTAAAAFVKVDTTTQGNWRAQYGVDGYNVIGDLASNPTYAAPTPTGQSAYTWAASTSDVRALQKASNQLDRIASTWYSGTSFTLDTNITDTVQHQIAIYCLDWDSTTRQERIDVLDTNGNVLNTQTLATSFNGGVYVVWNVTGHVVFRITVTGGLNAVISGIFFGGASTQVTPPAASAAFVKLDATSQGNWRAAYGADGYNVIGDLAANPAYATPAATGQSAYTWVASTNDIRATQKASNPADRIASTWYTAGSFVIDTNITDKVQHQVAIYCLDWDSTARREKIEVLDVNGNVLDTEALTASFNGGAYLVWNVTGHVLFRVTLTAGLNAVVSGLFFGGPASQGTGGGTPTGATAAFVKADATTQGNWRRAYGADGYNVIGDTSANPTYGALTATGQSQYVWAASTGDVRALQKASNAADRIAGTWYSASSFLIDSGITDTAQHQIAIYCLDWDSTARRETIDVLDANGNVLNTQTLATSFNGGTYLVWNVTGHVLFRVTLTGGLNAVVAGVFFGGAAGTPPPSTASASFVRLDSTTQGNWKTVYGLDGYNVIGDQASNPAYATPVASGQSAWTWAASTADVRGLAKASIANDRIASTWYSGGSFLIDSGITDQVAHEVAIYCLDWDSTARRETIDVLDTNGNVLNSQPLTTSFNGGVYLVWNVTGHVIFRVNLTAGINAVVSGVFFGGH